MIRLVSEPEIYRNVCCFRSSQRTWKILILTLAHTILKDFFNEFTRKHYDKIISRLNITDEELKGALDEILKLNPKPGSAYSDPQNKDTAHIIPDFILENNEGDLRLSLNAKNVPELRVSKTYSDMLQTYHHGHGNPSKSKRKPSAL